MARSKRGSDDVAPEDEEFVEYDPDEDVEDLDDDLDEDDEDDLDDDKPPAKAASGRRSGSRNTARPPKQRRGRGKSGRSRGARSPLGTEIDDGPRLSRRDRLASLQAQHKREHRRRVAALVTVCVVLAAAVLAWPVYLFVNDSILRATPRNEIGVPAAAAGCLPEESNQATGNQEHVEDGVVVPYPRLPPDSGPHYNVWAPFGTTFYDMADRPAVENLVHNLEHGYTILWYNADTISDEDAKALDVLAGTFNGQDPSTNKFIAAPWSPTTDGGAFPEGTNFLLVRWTADPQNPTDESKQFGVRQACAQLSGEAVVQFMERHPQPNSPEPNGG